MSGRGRGRGRKTATTHLDENTVENITKVAKINRKKQFPVVAVITPDGIQGTLQPEIKRPLIVHLPIQSKGIEYNDMPITYNPLPPSVPEPYDSYSANPFNDLVEQLHDNTLFQQEQIKHDVNNTNVSTVSNNQEEIIDFYNIKDTLLIKYKDTEEIKSIPESSDAACFWCCHTFTNRPVVLPLRDQGEYLYVFGNFCCPECAMAYLFDIRQDSHTRWEQLALLYRIYNDACNNKIYPAPSKNVLKLFGGPLSIEEYRNLIRSQKVRVDIHLPPMVSLLSTMDTKPIDFYDTTMVKNVAETVKDRLQKAEEVLRLKRTKPLKAWESTLDACINLKVHHSV
jgi:hypothetical protein